MWSWYVCFRGTEGRVSMIPTVTLLSRLPTHVFPPPSSPTTTPNTRSIISPRNFSGVPKRKKNKRNWKNCEKESAQARRKWQRRREVRNNELDFLVHLSTSTTGDHDHGKTSDNFIILNLGEEWHLMGTGLPSYAGHEISSRFALLLVIRWTVRLRAQEVVLTFSVGNE